MCFERDMYGCWEVMASQYGLCTGYPVVLTYLLLFLEACNNRMGWCFLLSDQDLMYITATQPSQTNE